MTAAARPTFHPPSQSSSSHAQQQHHRHLNGYDENTAAMPSRTAAPPSSSSSSRRQTLTNSLHSIEDADRDKTIVLRAQMSNGKTAVNGDSQVNIVKRDSVA